MTTASDSLDAAVGAARQVLAVVADVSQAAVLHATNNVVVAADAFVAKVSTDPVVARREYRLAQRAAVSGAAALAPVMEPVTVDGFTVVVQPRGTSSQSISRRHAAEAVASVQLAWRGFDDLPSLASRLTDALQLVLSGALDRVVDTTSRSTLASVLSQGIEAVDGSSVALHGEPHDGNFIVESSRVVVIDFEAACSGPLEWDAAFFPHEIAVEVWPVLDVELLDLLRKAVSATVSAHCWRHVAARGEDHEMRRHAQHHLDALRGCIP